MISAIKGFIHSTLVPLLLICTVPNLVTVLWFVAIKLNGSFEALLEYFKQNGGFFLGLAGIWQQTCIVSQLSGALLIGYLTWCILCMKFVPGQKVHGTITSTGHLPTYKDNGFRCYLLTLTTFSAISYGLYKNNLTPTVVYDKFDEIISTLNVFSFIFVLCICYKGLYKPSSKDCGSSGNFIFDFYWGTELYPKVYGLDVKVLTNCRFGMTLWGLLVCIFAMKSYELHGFVDSMFISTTLQMLYITKFFWWEAGYYKTIDIITDRAGFYICWGCLVFIPGFYASVSLYLVKQPVILGSFWSTLILSFGLLSLAINYWADAQRQQVRQEKGKCLVWGQKAKIIHATYQLESGEKYTNLLLASGWWGLSRHFHYIPELTLAFSWSVTVGFQHLMPFLYFCFLSVLLTHRSIRDDNKCSKKYGEFWKQYCKLVPYRIVPYVF